MCRNEWFSKKALVVCASLALLVLGGVGCATGGDGQAKHTAAYHDSSGVQFPGEAPQWTDAVLTGTVAKAKDGKGHVLKVSEGKTKEGKAIEELKGKEVALPADKAAECAKLCGKEVVMKCNVNKECKCTAIMSMKEKGASSSSEK